MFLLRMEAAEYVGERFYTFKPYNYGPFNPTIYQDLNRLVFSGFLRVEPSGNYKLYMATDAGKAKASEFAKSLDDVPREYLKKLVGWVSQVGFSQLLRSVYAKYPEYAKNSVFQD